MAGLSRTEKYRDLRNSLQSDTDTNTSNSKDLQEFADRLSRIDANSFQSSTDFNTNQYRSLHAREVERPQREVLKRHQHEQVRKKIEDEAKKEITTGTFDNNYLDQYIREVKQYNIDQGNALSDDTSVNILSQLHNDNSPLNRKKINLFDDEDDDLDIPFKFDKEEDTKKYTSRPFQKETKQDYTQELFSNEDDGLPEKKDNLTKEDIMAEVQNLIKGIDSSVKEEPKVTEDTDDMITQVQSKRKNDDYSTRQQLLNETTQMRAQLDDYEDNLTEVADKMRHTNQVLNIVLVILIVALVIMLAMIIYFIVLSKGVN